MHWQSVFVLAFGVCWILCLSSLAMGHPHHHSKGQKRKHANSRMDLSEHSAHHEKRGHRKRHIGSDAATAQEFGEDVLHDTRRGPGRRSKSHRNHLQNNNKLSDVPKHKSQVNSNNHRDEIPTKSFPDNRDTKSNFALPSNLRINEEEFRLEMIKEQILDKLQLRSPPTPSKHMNRTGILPPPLVEAEMGLTDTPIIAGNKNTKDFYATTAAMWVFGEEVPNCFSPDNPAACFKFTFKERLKPRDIAAAQLWVWKEADPRDSKNQTFVVSELNAPNRSVPRVKKIIATKETPLKEGWVQIDVKDMVRKWTQKPHKNHGLQVSCKTCLKSSEELPISISGNNIPMIMIQTEPTSARKKRSARSCSGCCKQEFTVNFTHIGWQDWIIQPTEYKANYCKGSCLGRITNDKNYHNLMLNFALMEEDGSNLQQAFTPCCTPTVMSGISILYYDNDGNIIQKNLPNMIVEECGCS